MHTRLYDRVGDADCLGQRFVQRHGGIGEKTVMPCCQAPASNANKYDGDVFHGVMRVDVGISVALDGQINRSECFGARSSYGYRTAPTSMSVLPVPSRFRLAQP